MFRLIADTSISWEYFRDANGFAYVSPSCTRLTGYTPEEFLSNPRLLEEIAHPSHRKSFLDHLSFAPWEHETARLKLRLISRDGRECWVEHVCEPVRDENGLYLGLRGSVRDIAQYKKDEALHNAYEIRYRVMAELQAEVVCRWLPDTTLTYVNDGYCRLNGRQREELLGKKWLSLVPPATRSSVEAYCRSLLAEPKLNIYEYGVTRADGEIRWFQWIDAPIYDVEGRLAEFQSLGRDLTRERRALLDLKDSEERFRTFMSQLPAVAFIKDAESRVLFTNRFMDRLLGSENWMGQRAPTELPPDVVEKILEDDRRVIESGQPLVIVEEMPTRGGEKRFFETRKFPLEQEGKPDLLGAIAIDITEKRQAEEALRSSEERYRLLAEASHDITYVIGRDDTVLYVNSAACRLIGKTPADVIGRKRSLLFPKEIAERQALSLKKVFETGKSLQLETIIPGAGQVTWQDTRLIPLKNREGEIYAVQGVSRDLTERKRMEDALRSSEELYRMLAEASHDPIFVIDRTDRVAYLNAASARTLGKACEDVIGKLRPSLDFTSHAREQQSEILKTVFTTGESYSVEGAYAAGKSLAARWYNLSLYPLKDSQGEVQSVLGVARDVTESRERAQRLEEANIALKVLLRHREEDRQDLEEQFLLNFKKLIMPSLEKLRKTGLNPRQSAYVDVVEMNVRKVFSASRGDAGLSHVNFTPIEMRIVEFIKHDKTTKEIGQLLNLSPRTVEYYRDKIRKKLGLKSKNVNLRSYLYTLS
jgi:PAS domain S-box-containing protein